MSRKSSRPSRPHAGREEVSQMLEFVKRNAVVCYLGAVVLALLTTAVV